MTSSASQSGNVLFYILLCIALFAALGYALSRNRVSNDGVSEQKAKLIASEVIAYSNLVTDTVSKLRLRGCTESGFEFSTSGYQLANGSNANSTNSNAPASGTCTLFDINGGNIMPKVFTEGFSGSPTGGNSKPGHARVRAYQIVNIGTTGATGTASANDLILSFAYINRNVCLAINNILGINNPGGEPPIPTYPTLSGVSLYSSGSYSGNGLIGSADLDGKKSFCRTINTGVDYSFDQVLIAR